MIMKGCKRSMVWYFDTPPSLRKWFSIQRFFYFTNTNASNSCPKRLVGNVKRKYSHQYVLITSLILTLCVHQPQSEKNMQESSIRSVCYMFGETNNKSYKSSSLDVPHPLIITIKGWFYQRCLQHN